MNRTLDAAHSAAHSADSLAALRAATASRHAALDTGLPIGAPDASLDDYTAHLALLRAWLAPLHAWQTGFADGPGPRWRSFMQALRAAVHTPAEIADACAGACAAFDSILALRAGSPPPRP
jgi:heme oxygenase